MVEDLEAGAVDVVEASEAAVVEDLEADAVEASEEEEEAAVDVDSEVGPFFSVLRILVVFPGVKVPVLTMCCLLVGGK